MHRPRTESGAELVTVDAAQACAIVEQLGPWNRDAILISGAPQVDAGLRVGGTFSSKPIFGVLATVID